jgi:hypothetical protein
MTETKKQSFLDLQKAVNVKKEKGQAVNYTYRNAEQILKRVKEVSEDWVITLTDSYQELNSGRVLLTATAIATNGTETYEGKANGYLEETAPILKLKAGGTKPQMSNPQWAGAISSYLRKYALQGLLAIADTDVDMAADEAAAQGATPQAQQPQLRDWSQAIASVQLPAEMTAIKNSMTPEEKHYYHDTMLAKFNELNGEQPQ